MTSDELKYAETRLTTMVKERWIGYEPDLMTADIALILAALAEAQAERDVLRAALEAITRLPVGICHGYDGQEYEEPCDRCEEAHDIAARLRPGTTALINAITQALIADPRAPVEVYADVAQSDPWARLWGSLSIAERGQVVAQAKKEAGR